MGMNTGGTENHQECQGKNFTLTLSFHGVKIHFHHFHDLLETMKICLFSQILKEPDFCSSLVRHYTCNFCFVLFCQLCVLSEGYLSYHRHQTDFTIFTSHALKTLILG